MTFLNELQNLDPIQANQLLRKWIENHPEALFRELRENRPVLSFFSFHPGNPDILNDLGQKKPGYAHLLSRWNDVKYALEEFSMKPYERVSRANRNGHFILALEGPEHDAKKDTICDALSHEKYTENTAAICMALSDDDCLRKMDESIHEAWQQFSGFTPYSNKFDVKIFVRTAVLKFTGKFFGIPEKLIFEGEDNLEKWSEVAYENFIWKLHARHFGYKNPPLDGALKKIAGLIAVCAKIESEEYNDTVIGRLFGKGKKASDTSGGRTSAPVFNNPDEIIANIVGLIQGLVDNAMTGTCNALYYMLSNGEDHLQQVRQLRFGTDGFEALKAEMHKAHRADAPSPYLPRCATVEQLNFLVKRRNYLRDLKKRTQDDDEELKKLEGLSFLNSEFLGSLDAGGSVVFSCAIGSAMEDYMATGSSEEKAEKLRGKEWDIRMGSGAHKCVGQYIGDDLMVRIIAKILDMPLKSTSVSAPLSKQWGWIINNFELHSNRMLSYMMISRYTSYTRNRPHPYTLKSDYVNWSALRDKTYFARHLGPANKKDPNVDYGDITKMDTDNLESLFKRGEFKKSHRSSLLFAFFAQWLTDSVLRTRTRLIDDPNHPDLSGERNTSNHHIDLCQIYGLTDEVTNILRSKSDGMLKTHVQKKREGKIEVEHIYPPLLFHENGKVKKEFEALPYVKNGKYLEFLKKDLNSEEINEALKKNYFATGLERGNSTFAYSALSTLFLRAHNKICQELKSVDECQDWDDERLFQTARMILIAIKIKIIIEEYINHITSGDPDQRIFLFDQSFVENAPWYRENWITIEFDLLYRWHSLIPDDFYFSGMAKPASFKSLRSNNDLLIENGLEWVLQGLSQNKAGAIELFNTSDFLFHAEKATLQRERAHRIRSYNEYREHFKLKKIETFEKLNKNEDIQKQLKEKYEKVDDIGFVVGLYAEQPKGDDLFGELMKRMVAYDAFTQALTNPILSSNVWNHKTFTQKGMEIIESVSCLNDLLEWNTKSGRFDQKISMDS